MLKNEQYTLKSVWCDHRVLHIITVLSTLSRIVLQLWI